MVQKQPQQSQTQTGTSMGRTGAGTEQEIRDFMDRFAQAFKSRNLDEIMSFYAQDVVAFDIMPPLQYKGVNEFRKSWQQFIDMTVGSPQYQVQDVNIKIGGDLAACYCLSHMVADTKSGEKIDTWMRYTGVYSKINGQWKISHEQLSVPIDMKTDKAIWDLQPGKEIAH